MSTFFSLPLPSLLNSKNLLNKIYFIDSLYLFILKINKKK